MERREKSPETLFMHSLGEIQTWQLCTTLYNIVKCIFDFSSSITQHELQFFLWMQKIAPDG